MKLKSAVSRGTHKPEVDLDRIYEMQKQSWAAEHPAATPAEYEKAIREIAERLGV